MISQEHLLITKHFEDEIIINGALFMKFMKNSPSIKYISF